MISCVGIVIPGKSGENPAQFRYGIYGICTQYATGRGEYWYNADTLRYELPGRRVQVLMYKSGYRRMRSAY